jgi:LDH2 family malate/lactate/ureidoglycolate dehydrogenase
MIPGEPERRTAADRSATGIPVADEVWQSIVRAAGSVGLDAGRLPPGRA